MMKTLLSVLIFSAILLIACNNPKEEKEAPPSEVPVAEPVNIVPASAMPSLAGLWELSSISDSKVNLAKLYPGQKPNLNFDLQGRAVRGSTTCNRFSCQVKIEGEKMNFGDPAMTKVACPGDGEKVFLEALKTINSYSIIDSNFLLLRADSVEIMRFSRKMK
ncbi:MAG: META domain-containing protein [Chitinophagaceae bacterium]|nr:META domain-containing protein [Chitinophagaceae bacterium]